MKKHIIIKLLQCLYQVSVVICFTSSTIVNSRTQHQRTHQRGDELKLMATSKAEGKTTKKKINHTGSKKKRLKKHQIDDLVRNIGLTPVAKKTKSHNLQQQKTIDTKLSYDLQSPNISLKTQLDYSRNGHAALRSFLPKELIKQLRKELISYTTTHSLLAWRQKVEVQLADSSDEYYKDNACPIANNLKSIEECQDMLESLGIDTSNDLPFLQHFNTWRASTNNSTPAVRKLCLSHYMAQTASILLNTPTIRLYQDSLFHKRVGDGPTPWHSDARMSPFDTSNMITFWIPLQKVSIPEEGGTGLLYVDASHSDFALPYWNGVDSNEYDRLENRYGDNDGGVNHHMPLDIGDVTVHNGWTLHSADAAEFIEEGQDRYAFSVTYVDGRAEVREDILGDDVKGDREDVWSFRDWVKDVFPRQQFSHPSVPIVWPIDKRDVKP